MYSVKRNLWISRCKGLVLILFGRNCTHSLHVLIWLETELLRPWNQKYLRIMFTVLVTPGGPLHSWYSYMIFVSSSLGITLTNSNPCCNLTALQSIPFWSIPNSVFTLPDATFLTISLQNLSSFWCDLSIGISISLCVRSQMELRWWTSTTIFSMPSLMPLAVGLFLPWVLYTGSFISTWIWHLQLHFPYLQYA